MKAIIELAPCQIERMIKEAAPVYAREKALQDSLEKTYTVQTAALRLSVCMDTVFNLIRDGRIRFTTVGKKGYRISELACREFLGDVK